MRWNKNDKVSMRGKSLTLEVKINVVMYECSDKDILKALYCYTRVDGLKYTAPLSG